MHRRLSTAEKGKTVALEHRPAPRTARVRLTEPDNADLLKKHSLTLIGKVTNPSAQKVWSLIPFFIDHWKADVPPIGSDLGSGMFQFQFELESDLLTVLAKQPYHYARWMIILERWAPTISPSFPSMIPFWITIQGVPVHLWTETAARQIGEDIGTYESTEVTSLTFRMRVHVNGRLPLIKTTILEYPNGDEVTASLVYEKLDRHCIKCCRLDQDIRDCLEAKHEKKALLASQEDTYRDNGSFNSKEVTGTRNRYEKKESRRPPYRRDEHPRPPSRGHYQQRSHLSSARDGVSEVYHRGRSLNRQEWQPRRQYNSEHTRRREEVQSYKRDDNHRDKYMSSRGESHSAYSPRSNVQPRSTKKENEPTLIRSCERGPKDQGIPCKEGENDLPQAAMEEAIGEVWEYMTQYINCADPLESAARRERLRQAEAEGQIEESAAHMVRAAITRKDVADAQTEVSPAERVHIAARLGPLNQDNTHVLSPENLSSRGRNERVPISSRLGPQEDQQELETATIAVPEKSQK